MRYLIDGYNLMYAAGLLGKKLGPDRFRQVRTRFLNDVASALGPIESQLTTVVFDASQAPDDQPTELNHQGISVIFAVDNENADERIEELIAPSFRAQEPDGRLLRPPHSNRRDASQGARDDGRRFPRLARRPPQETEGPPCPKAA